jgi:hypothetical protein
MAPGAREIGAVLRLQEGDHGHLAHCGVTRSHSGKTVAN